MEDAEYHRKAIEEGIMRATFIRQDLAKTFTEYEPKKVRGLNKAYIETIKEVVKQGELFLDKTDDIELGVRIAQIIENYRAFLSTLKYDQ
tara:strand:- start:154 stop:423 length:270 start_codon:yes stop_codon:yes gene_type:complete